MQRKIIPDIVKEQDVVSFPASASVVDAAKAMADANIAAVIVVDDAGKLTGIVTERDITHRAVAKGTDLGFIRLGDIMTANPDTLAPDDNAGDALELMTNRGYRHLPVANDDKKCIGMVSIRDLYAAVKSSLEDDIRDTEAFVFGDRYSA